MAPIEKLTISGFRGILTPLELPFKKGKSVRSMVIYGQNGTGKSSITDAWEWLHTGKIDRLAREGAGPRSYPHTDARDDDTYVEVFFTDPALEVVRLQFDPDRPTMPEAAGDIDNLRVRIPHSCHIRFGDLTEFVYSTKAEKYDRLAGLMGFAPQVEFQKALNRTLRKLSEELEASEDDVERIAAELDEILEPEALQERALLKRINQVLDRNELGSADSVDAVQTASERLRERIQNDPRSRELSDLSELEKACKKATVPEEVWDEVSGFTKAARRFKQQEGETVDLLLIDLYTKGQEVLDDRRVRDESTDRCPLCGQTVNEAELLTHITEELERLRALKEARDELEAKRQQVTEQLDELDGLSSNLKEGYSELSLSREEWPFEDLADRAEELQSEAVSIDAILAKPPEELTEELISRLPECRSAAEERGAEFDSARQTLVDRITERQEDLRKDETRSRLVSDHELLRDGLDRWNKWRNARRALQGLQSVHERFETIVNAFIADSMENVQERFQAISADVDRFFGILEERTEGISSPRLKLLTDQDRAVMLEVEFRGEDIRPAYKYLSESQLNSFGLAVFLASAKHFNPDFPFLLLDDVINSFDGYKRPQVIRLLKEEFPDHQFLVLTHDRVWTDRLFETFPG
jgi:DNA repair exonuclease SbcCD ATPase subunit